LECYTKKNLATLVTKAAAEEKKTGNENLWSPFVPYLAIKGMKMNRSLILIVLACS
jgi:hypothetical protein